jgi:hypothetical protein
MHMDESTNSISPNELDPGSASDRISAATDALPAELAMSRERAALGRQPHSDPIRLRQNELHFGASVSVYCGSEEAVALGFRMALSAMAAPTFEETVEPRETKP